MKKAFPAKGQKTIEKEDLYHLGKRVKLVDMDREILKKAAAFFAKESL